MAVACQKPLDDATLEVYFEGLAKKAEPEAWESFTKRASTDDTFRGDDGVLWFPKLPDLIDAYLRASYEARETAVSGLLSDDTRTPDEKRADAARMLDTIKAELAAREAELPPAPVVNPPPEPTIVVLDQYSERLDELRRQARAIAEQPEPTTVEGGV